MIWQALSIASMTPISVVVNAGAKVSHLAGGMKVYHCN